MSLCALPDEIIESIFRNVGHYSKLANCLTVCKKFHSILKGSRCWSYSFPELPWVTRDKIFQRHLTKFVKSVDMTQFSEDQTPLEDDTQEDRVEEPASESEDDLHSSASSGDDKDKHYMVDLYHPPNDDYEALVHTIEEIVEKKERRQERETRRRSRMEQKAQKMKARQDSRPAPIPFPPVREERKVVFVGPYGAGNTCMLLRLSSGEFPVDYIPTVCDNFNVHLPCGARPLTIALWDTAGLEEYDRLRPLSYPGTHLFVLSFAVNSRKSFEEAIHKFSVEIGKFSQTPKLLVGMKADLHGKPAQPLDAVSYDEGVAAARALGYVGYVELSARTLPKGMENLHLRFLGLTSLPGAHPQVEQMLHKMQSPLEFLTYSELWLCVG